MGNITAALSRPLIFLGKYLFAVLFWSILIRPISDIASTVSLRDLQKRREGLVLICLEKGLHKDDQIETAIKRLKEKKLNSILLNDYNECEQWLMNYNGNQSIILIISNTYGKQIVPHIHHLSSIVAIFVYINNRRSNRQWIEHCSKVQGNSSDLNELVEQASMRVMYLIGDSHYLQRTLISPTEVFHKERSLDQNKVVQEGGQTDFQFVLIDLSARLDEVSSGMLKCLRALAKDSILIFDDPSLVDFSTLPDKITLLFVSREFASQITDKPARTQAMFILEDKENDVDYRESFSNGEDLIFQLADELHQCYRTEAKNCSTLGNSLMAEMKENQANRVHNELKKVYKSLCRDDSIITTPTNTTTTLIWLQQKSENDTEIQKLQSLLSEIVSSFQLVDNIIDCNSYLQNNGLYATIFLIASAAYEESSIGSFRQFPNVKFFYRTSRTSSPTAAVVNKCHDHCFELISKLAAHYYQLGSECSAKQDSKTARDMFLKAAKLYHILAKF